MPDVSQCLTTHHMCLKYANWGGSHNLSRLEMTIVSFVSFLPVSCQSTVILIEKKLETGSISICVIPINWTVEMMGNILVDAANKFQTTGNMISQHSTAQLATHLYK